MTRMTGAAYALDSVAEDWRLDAACRNYPPTWWELDHKGRRDSAEYRMAHRICRRCPVTAQCLKLGQIPGTEGVILGGVDHPTQRRPRLTPRVDYCQYCHNRYEVGTPQQRFCTEKCRMANMRAVKRAKRAEAVAA